MDVRWFPSHPPSGTHHVNLGPTGGTGSMAEGLGAQKALYRLYRCRITFISQGLKNWPERDEDPALQCTLVIN